MEKLQSTPLQQFAKAEGFSSISKVRENVNGFPYVTMVGENREAENIYFSKRCASEVILGQSPSEAGLSSYNIVVTQNEAGETRLKLTTSTYESIDSLFA